MRGTISIVNNRVYTQGKQPFWYPKALPDALRIGGWTVRHRFYGDVKVSTGILQYDKRVEPGNLLKSSNLKPNANDELALAA